MHVDVMIVKTTTHFMQYFCNSCSTFDHFYRVVVGVVVTYSKESIFSFYPQQLPQQLPEQNMHLSQGFLQKYYKRWVVVIGKQDICNATVHTY